MVIEKRHYNQVDELVGRRCEFLVCLSYSVCDILLFSVTVTFKISFAAHVES